MEEELSLDNILEADEIENLFSNNEEEQEKYTPENKTDDNSEQQNNQKDLTKDTTEEVDVENLFSSDTPESVGSGTENTKEKEDTTPKGSGSSPKNFYSSIAKALKEEGIFPDLEDNSLSNVKEPEDFRDLIEKQISAGIDEKQKRVSEALDVGIEPDDIKKYENQYVCAEEIGCHQTSIKNWLNGQRNPRPKYGIKKIYFIV